MCSFKARPHSDRGAEPLQPASMLGKKRNARHRGIVRHGIALVRGFGTSMLRRDLLKSTVASVAGALALAPAGGAEASSELEATAAELTKELYASDGLALPIPSTPTVSDLAKGRDRTLVLGAGGEYYLGWYCGFFHGLYDHGLDMNAMSEMVVGTSAGSYMGSSLTSGHFLRLRSEFKFFGHFPSLFAKLTPLSSSNPSQERAMKLSAAAKDGEISTRQTIGRAALAADNRVNGGAVSPRLIWMLTGDSRTDWPVAKIYTSSVDCYTGERLIVSQVAARKNGNRNQLDRGRLGGWCWRRSRLCTQLECQGGIPFRQPRRRLLHYKLRYRRRERNARHS